MNKLLKNDNAIRFFSVLVAFLLWFYVSLQNPDVEVTYRGIPVRINNLTRTESGNELVVLGEEIRIDITVNGKRSQLIDISSSDFVAYIDMSGNRDPRSYYLPISVVMPTTEISLIKQSVTHATIEVDAMVAETVPVSVEIDDAISEAGFYVKNPVADPDQITLIGPSTVLAQIEKAVVNVELTSAAGIEGEEFDFVFADGSGYPVESEYITTATEKVFVSVGVQQVKDVPVVAVFSGAGASWSESEFSYKVSPELLVLTGRPDVLSSIEQIVLPVIDLSKIEESIDIVLTVTLPEGAELASGGNPEVTVSITISAMYEKTLEVRRAEFLNVPDGRTARLAEPYIPVRVRGSMGELQRVFPENIRLVIDLANVPPGADSSVLTASVVTDEGIGVGVLGSYEVEVILTDNGAENPGEGGDGGSEDGGSVTGQIGGGGNP